MAGQISYGPTVALLKSTAAFNLTTLCTLIFPFDGRTCTHRPVELPCVGHLEAERTQLLGALGVGEGAPLVLVAEHPPKEFSFLAAERKLSQAQKALSKAQEDVGAWQGSLEETT